MKKFFAIVATLAVFGSITQTKAQASFDKGDKILNLGVGIFSLGANASFEYGIQKNLGVGAYLSYERPSIGLLGTALGRNYSYSYLNAGVRAVYHFNELLNFNDEKFDLYGAGGVGIYSYSYPYDYYYYADVRRTYIGPQVHLRAGARYFLSSKMAGWADIGSGGSWIQGGIAFKF